MTMTIEVVAIINASSFIVEEVEQIDTTINPPETWPSNWISSSGTVNLPQPSYTYVQALNGFLPPKPSPTFVLDTSDLTWYPDPEVYYYWTDPVERYYRYNKATNDWTPHEFIGSSVSAPLPLPDYPVLGLSVSKASVNPGDFIDIVLTSSGSNQPINPVYSLSVEGDLVEIEFTQHTYEVTVGVSSRDGSTPVFYVGGLELPAITLFKGATYEFLQDDASNVGHALLLSESFNGVYAVPEPGTVYGTNIDYYLDGVKVANSAEYLSGFDLATQRKLVINSLSTLQDTDLFYFDNAGQTQGGPTNSNYLPVAGDGPLSGSFFNHSGGGTVRLGVGTSESPLTSSAVTVTVSSYTQKPVMTSFNVVPL